MNKRSSAEKKLLKVKKILKQILLSIEGFLIIAYLIKGGLYSLLFDLRESKAVIVYSVIISILLIVLIMLNAKDTPPNQSEKQVMLSSYITVGIIAAIIFFGVLLMFTLIDFFLPIMVLTVILTVIYFVTLEIVKKHV